MKRIGVVGNPKYRNVPEALGHLVAVASQHEFELFVAAELRSGREAEVTSS